MTYKITIHSVYGCLKQQFHNCVNILKCKLTFVFLYIHIHARWISIFEREAYANFNHLPEHKQVEYWSLVL